MDDLLWQQSLGVERHFDEQRNQLSLLWNHDEQMLARMIHLGTVDRGSEERPWDASTRAMRHSSIMAERLWSLWELERDRVRVRFISLVTLPLIILFDYRETVWSVRSTRCRPTLWRCRPFRRLRSKISRPPSKTSMIVFVGIVSTSTPSLIRRTV